jgi:hypothetical protein
MFSFMQQKLFSAGTAADWGLAYIGLSDSVSKYQGVSIAGFSKHIAFKGTII